MESNLIQNLEVLEKLSERWQILPFEKVVKEVSGGNIKIKKGDFQKHGKFPVIDQGKDIVGGYTNEQNNLIKTDGPHIVFGDHTRSLKYVDFPFAMGADGIKCLKLKNEKEIDYKFIYYFFCTLNIPNTGYNRHYKYLKSTKIPLPPLKTQQKIAAILDEADKLRQLDKKLIKKYEALSQSLFLEMFGDPVNNPKGWDMVPMNHICDFKRQSITPERISSEMKYIPLDAIQKGTGKILGYESVEEGEIKSSKFYFTENHILYGKLRPYLNKVGLPNFDGICSTDIIPILPIESKTNKYFISTIMRNIGFVSFADENSSGANLPRISPKEIEKFSTINPPFESQKIFGERIREINKQKLSIQDSLKISDELFNSLLQKAFKGELV